MIENIEEITEKIRKYTKASVSESRYEHSIRTAETCAELCSKYGLDVKTGEETKAQYETKISEAETEISQMKQKSRQEIEKNRDSQLQAAKDEAERIIREAKAEATREKDRIISEAQSEISEMVTDATEKLALQATAGEAFDQFLDAVDLAEERGSKHEQ